MSGRAERSVVLSSFNGKRAELGRLENPGRSGTNPQIRWGKIREVVGTALLGRGGGINARETGRWLNYDIEDNNFRFGR